MTLATRRLAYFGIRKVGLSGGGILAAIRGVVRRHATIAASSSRTRRAVSARARSARSQSLRSTRTLAIWRHLPDEGFGEVAAEVGRNLRKAVQATLHPYRTHCNCNRNARLAGIGCRRWTRTAPHVRNKGVTGAPAHLAVEAVGGQQFLRSQHRERHEELGTDFVLPAFAVRGRDQRGAIALAMREVRQHPVVLIVGMRRRHHERADGIELAQCELEGRLAFSNLRKSLHRMQTLPWAAAVEATGSVLRFAIDTDVHAFETALREQRIADALPLWRGDLLRGFDDDANEAWTGWLAFERNRLRALWKGWREYMGADDNAGAP